MRRARAWLRTIVALTAAQRRLLYVSLALMFVARLASLVLPASSRFLVDNVLRTGQRWALLPLVGAIAGATLVQSVAEYFRTRCSRIVEYGRHQSLWAKRGRYYEIMQTAIRGEMSAVATPPDGHSLSDPALVL